MTRPSPTFYVFHGTDEFTRAETLADFKRRLGPPDTVDLNTTWLDGGKVTLAELRHACDAIPFMADRRLVIVEGLLARLASRREGEQSVSQRDYLEALCGYLVQLPETTRLVFVEDRVLPADHPILRLAQREEQGYVKQFDPPKAQLLPRWVEERTRKHGGEIEPAAAQYLAALVGAELRLLDQEIAKLVIYVNGERPIAKGDVEVLVPYARQAIIFDLVDALGRRDGQTAARVLHGLLEAGEHPLGLLTMIVRQFRLLIQAKELGADGASSQDIARALGLHPFPARKLCDQAPHFTAPQLETVYRHLLEVDVGIKRGEIEAEVALDLLVAGLAAEE